MVPRLSGAYEVNNLDVPAKSKKKKNFMKTKKGLVVL